MWGEVASFAVGLLAGPAATFIEPLNRLVGRVGRKTARDRGLAVHVETDPAVIWAGTPDWVSFQFCFPTGLPDEPPPAGPRDWRRWAFSHGGYDLWESVVRLTLVGTAPVAVVVEMPVVTVTSEPLQSCLKVVRPVGGADIAPRAYTVDLDSFGHQNPVVELEDGGGSVRHDPLSFSLERNGVEQILLRVQSSSPCLYSWHARLPVLVDGKRQYVEVDDQGSPFFFVGGDLADGNIWDGQKWAPCTL
ncbi:hypothetical protein [Tessaracoccus sp. ZS01]|uniref:hypothetical protein n=1 Tax=Tessaracoccus sp. ZS01 TaxID=1906324 RepID=UPI00117CFA46|nr:hypothetical protein [Tessaracoccus sp. ZS01]